MMIRPRHHLTFLVPPHAQVEKRLRTDLANEEKRLVTAKAAATTHRKAMSGAGLNVDGRQSALAEQRKLDAKVELIRDNLSLRKVRT